MTHAQISAINYTAAGGKPVSLYLDDEAIALLARVQVEHGLRNRSAAVRFLAAAWSEERRPAEA